MKFHRVPRVLSELPQALVVALAVVVVVVVVVGSVVVVVSYFCPVPYFFKHQLIYGFEPVQY